MIVPASSSKHHRIDITTALMQNHPPHYALPADLLPVLPVLSLESSSQMNNITALMLSISPAMSSVVHVFHDLKRLAAWLEAQSSMPDIERDCLFVSLFLDPIAHRELSDCAPLISATPPSRKGVCAGGAGDYHIAQAQT